MPYQYLILLVFVPVAAYMYYRSFKGQKKWSEQNVHLTVGEIAKRLKLKILQGDVQFNMVTRQQFNLSGTKEIQVHLAGMPYAHPFQIFYDELDKVETGVLANTRYQRFDSYLEVLVENEFPAFEVWHKHSTKWNQAVQQLDLPKYMLGHGLDEHLEFTCGSPGFSEKLVPALHSLVGLGYVHIVGQGRTIRFVMTHTGMVTAIPELDLLVHTLESLACAVEDKPLPGAYQTAKTDAQAPLASSTQVPIPCKTCGAPMKEVGDSDPTKPVEVVCPYCQAREVLPQDKTERVQALRTRLQHIDWLTKRNERSLIAMSQIGEKGLWLPMLILCLVMMAVFIYGDYTNYVDMLERIKGLSVQEQQRTLAEFGGGVGGLSVGAMLGMFVYILFAWTTYRTWVRPRLLARAPITSGQALRCRNCGGDLPEKPGAFVTCLFCHAQNLVASDIARKQATLLDEEIQGYRKQAAQGIQQTAQMGAKVMRLFYIVMAVCAGAGLVLGKVMKTIIISKVA